MRKTLPFIILCSIVACDSLLGQRSEPEPPLPRSSSTINNTVAQPISRPPALEDGKELYERLCSTCHRALQHSEIARTTPDLMRQALDNVPEMNKLRDLPDEYVSLIAEALSKIPPGKARSQN